MQESTVPTFSITTYGVSDDTLALLDFLRWLSWAQSQGGVSWNPPSGGLIPGGAAEPGGGAPSADWNQLDDETKRLLGLIPTFTTEAVTTVLPEPERVILNPPLLLSTIGDVSTVMIGDQWPPITFTIDSLTTVIQSSTVTSTTEAAATFTVEVTTTAPVETTTPTTTTTVPQAVTTGTGVVVVDFPPVNPQPPAQPPAQPPSQPSPQVPSLGSLPSIPMGGGGGTIAPAQPVGSDAVIKALLSTYYKANRIPTLAEILAGGIQQ
jgi:hypothetical protein